MMIEKQELDGAIRLNGERFQLGKLIQSEDKVVAQALSGGTRKKRQAKVTRMTM